MAEYYNLKKKKTVARPSGVDFAYQWSWFVSTSKCLFCFRLCDCQRGFDSVHLYSTHAEHGHSLGKRKMQKGQYLWDLHFDPVLL